MQKKTNRASKLIKLCRTSKRTSTKKFRIWETLNLTMCAGKKLNILVMCHASPVTCHLSPASCHLSPVTNANSHIHRSCSYKLSHYAQQAGLPTQNFFTNSFSIYVQTLHWVRLILGILTNQLTELGILQRSSIQFHSSPPPGPPLVPDRPPPHSGRHLPLLFLHLLCHLQHLLLVHRGLHELGRALQFTHPLYCRPTVQVNNSKSSCSKRIYTRLPFSSSYNIHN